MASNDLWAVSLNGGMGVAEIQYKLFEYLTSLSLPGVVNGFHQAFQPCSFLKHGRELVPVLRVLLRSVRQNGELLSDRHVHWIGL